MLDLLYPHMTTVLVALLLGIALGKLVNSRVLKANDTVFTVLSTIFIFIMGISLGLSKSTFAGVGNLLIDSVALAIIGSLGSILSIRLLLNRGRG